MSKFNSVLIKLVMLGLLLSPVMLLYWLITDPVNCITNLIGAAIWLVIVIIPLSLFFLFALGVFSLVWSIIKTILS